MKEIPGFLLRSFGLLLMLLLLSLQMLGVLKFTQVGGVREALDYSPEVSAVRMLKDGVVVFPL